MCEETQKLLRTMLEGTWYTTDPSHHDVYRTTYGTVPGAPLADILFVITYTVFVEAFQAELRSAGLLCTLSQGKHGPRLTAPIPTWLDDSAVLIHSRSAEMVEKDMAQAADIARRLLRCIGIPLNLSPGKSEALILINGKTMRSERRRLLIDQNCHISLPGQGSLQVTDHYVHLGTHVNYRASPAADLTRRAQLAEAAFKPLQRRLLANRHLTFLERACMLEGMVIQKFLFGLERWHFTVQRDWQSFHTHYMSFLRRSVRPLLGVSSKYMTDLQVATVLHFLTPDEARRVQLARALWQALHADIPYLHCSLLHEGTWLQHAHDCCNHILVTLGETPLPSPATADTNVEQWREHFLRRMPQAAKLCQRYRKHCCLTRQALADDTLASFQYRAVAEKQGVLLVHLLPEAEIAVQPAAHACPECAKLFYSRSAMASHRQKVHGQQAPATTEARGTACQACRHEYWSTSRLRDHLRHQPQCLATYAQADLPSAGLHEFTPADRLFRPSTQLVGPQPFWAALRPAPSSPPTKPTGADPLHEALGHALQHSQGCRTTCQVFTSLAPKLHRLCETPDEAELVLDEFLAIHPLALYTYQLCRALCQLARTKCSQPFHGGSLRIFGRWLFWVPDTVQFCPERSRLEA